MTDLRTIVKEGSRLFAILAVVLAAVWSVGRPLAENFVLEAVKDQNEQVQTSIEKIEEKQAEGFRAQDRIGSDVRHIKETHDDIKRGLDQIREMLLLRSRVLPSPRLPPR